ncbi:MAG TPA: MFS transporter [Tepidisphaeraceae bacterium]|nr:MFS transporter [Tepidisphaeraceae bacterium]
MRKLARNSMFLLLLINLMNYVDRQILAAVERPIGGEFAVGADITGWLPSAFLASYMFFSPIFGVVGDRVRRWTIIGIGVIGWSLASGGSGAASSLTMLFLMRILIGTGEAAYGPIAPTVIADLFPIEARGKALSWFYAAIPVGSALGYVIGGLLHEHWRWAFYLTLPPGILLGFICFIMPEPPRGDETRGRRALWSDYWHLLRIKSYVLDSAGMTAMTFALGGIAFFMPRYLESAGLDPRESIPVFGGIACVAGILGTMAGGIFGDKLKPKMPSSYFVVSGTGMVIGFPLILLMLITPFPACWIVIFLAVFCLFVNTGPSNAIIANVTHANVRATAFAVNILAIHLFGDSISGPVVGGIAKTFGLRSAFAVVSVLTLLGGIFWLWGAKYLRADVERASASMALQV